MRRAAVILFAAVLPASASQWIRLSTPDFELYTTSGEKTGKEILLHFEQVRDFFLHASPFRKVSDFPVRIIEFGSERQFQQYRVNAFSTAYFVNAPENDYIVMSEASKGFSVATHEYTHLVVRHSGLKIPVWLNEGWAEVNSTLRPMGKGVAVGDLIESRMHDLETKQWLDIYKLISVNPLSPEYNEASLAGIFYAESWALVHMLYLAPDYQQHFGEFVMALNQGKSTSEAFRIAWNRIPTEVFSDLRSYLNRKKIYGRVFETRLIREAAAPVVSDVNDFDADLMLADLLTAIGKRSEAREAYAKLDAQQPGRADVARSRGFLAIRDRDAAATRRYFGQAFDAGDADPRMCFQLALLDRAAKQPLSRVISELERAVKSKPDYSDAEIELGLVNIEANRFDSGIASLTALKTVTSARAPAVYCGLAYARIETGELDSARASLDTCGKSAQGDAETRRVDELARLLTARSRPEVAVHRGEKLRQVAGIARNLDCSPDGNRLQVQVGDKTFSFDLPAPDAVELTRLKGSSFDLVCGPQKPFRLMLDFAPPHSAMETSVGIVRRMEF